MAIRTAESPVFSAQVAWMPWSLFLIGSQYLLVYPRVIGSLLRSRWSIAVAGADQWAFQRIRELDSAKLRCPDQRVHQDPPALN